MRSTYKPDDVTLLLTDLSGRISGIDTLEREKRIQSGAHYSEMLPVEYKPGKKYAALYRKALERFSEMTALAVSAAAEQIYAVRGKNAALVSLARAGISAGVLIKRYIARKYSADIAHYAISIIRGKGIDGNAMSYILARHSAKDVQFVDGWTGKGAIARELAAATARFPGVDGSLAVLSDPPGLAGIRGSFDDFLIPCSCLNATVSGLLSRTVLNETLISKDDFHGAVFYQELAPYDRTYEFIDSIEARFSFDPPVIAQEESFPRDAEGELRRIREDFAVSDINFIKPGIGEATRVLLRRLPWKLLVHSLDDEACLGHLYQLAKEKNARVETYPLRIYKACGIIRKIDS
jgi:hypothetical protein